MTFFRKAAPLVMITALSVALAGCAQSDRTDTPPGSTGDAVAAGGSMVFGAAGAPKLFDPFYATDGETFRVTRQLFEGLLDIKPGTAEVIPGLASEMPTPSDNGLDWTFKLRTGIKFHDGTEFNADAVCKNFERMFDQNPAAQSSAASYWADTMGAFKDKAAESLYKGCSVTDPSTVVLSVTRTTSKFPTMLSLSSFSMQSPTAMDKGQANDVKAQGDGFVFPAYSQAPVGTGPFTFDKYDEANKTVTLVRNDSYWGDKAKLDKLIFKIVPDESTRRQELKAGSIQGYDLPNPVDWKGLKDDGNQVLVRPAFNILYMGLNPKKNPKLADLKVRQALYYALNREQLVQTQLPEGATVATQFMPDTVSGYNKDLKPVAYDKAKAQQLLKEAGAEGMTLEFAYPTEVSRPYMPDPQKIFEALRSDLEAVGVKVKVVAKPWNGGYLEGIDKGLFDAWIVGWTGDYDAADNFIGTFFASTTNDFQTFSQPWGKTLSDQLNAADTVVDENERIAAYEKVNQAIMEQYLPGLPLTHSPPALVVSKDVQGLVASPLTAEEFSTTTVGGK
ncbi:MAG: ABC transporter substrate-binding protein [Dermatophilaceae bacterium]